MFYEFHDDLNILLAVLSYLKYYGMYGNGRNVFSNFISDFVMREKLDEM